jgi:hypothetical protein
VAIDDVGVPDRPHAGTVGMSLAGKASTAIRLATATRITDGISRLTALYALTFRNPRP